MDRLHRRTRHRNRLQAISTHREQRARCRARNRLRIGHIPCATCIAVRLRIVIEHRSRQYRLRLACRRVVIKIDRDRARVRVCRHVTVRHRVADRHINVVLVSARRMPDRIDQRHLVRTRSRVRDLHREQHRARTVLTCRHCRRQQRARGIQRIRHLLLAHRTIGRFHQLVAQRRVQTRSARHAQHAAPDRLVRRVGTGFTHVLVIVTGRACRIARGQTIIVHLRRHIQRHRHVVRQQRDRRRSLHAVTISVGVRVLERDCPFLTRFRRVRERAVRIQYQSSRTRQRICHQRHRTVHGCTVRSRLVVVCHIARHRRILRRLREAVILDARRVIIKRDRQRVVRGLRPIRILDAIRQIQRRRVLRVVTVRTIQRRMQHVVQQRHRVRTRCLVRDLHREQSSARTGRRQRIRRRIPAVRHRLLTHGARLSSQTRKREAIRSSAIAAHAAGQCARERRQLRAHFICRACRVAIIQTVIIHRRSRLVVVRRHMVRRRSITTATTQRRQNQQRQPPQRHRRHARAQRLPSLHPVRQHAHRIRPHRALRHVRIHIAVLVRAHQQVVRALAVANLAVVLVVVLNHQIGLLHITPFKRDVQVLAHALGRDVLRAVPRRLVREVVLDIAQRLDAHALATGSNAPFAPGNLHGMHRLAGVVDLQDDVLQAHDASLFPRQRLVFMGALRESCGGGSSSRATARSMTVR